MFENCTNIIELKNLLDGNPAVLVYFSTDDCSVCKVLKPKVEQLIVSNFPQIKGVYINVNQAPELAAEYAVFTVPTVLIFLESRELLRKSRSFGISQLYDEIKRPYQLMFT